MAVKNQKSSCMTPSAKRMTNWKVESIIGIDERGPITEAADLMHRYGVQHLLVRKAATVVGVLSVEDLLQ